MATLLVVVGLAVHQFVVRRGLKDNECERLERTNARVSDKGRGFNSASLEANSAQSRTRAARARDSVRRMIREPLSC